jgi:dTDP-3-amino-3,4,6-trideoxy-alpha-D-glucose transaminase
MEASSAKRSSLAAAVPPVPLFATSLEPHHEALTAALARVVPTERFILGPEVEAFEAELAAHLGVGHCIGVANGTDALAIALRALGVSAGEEVIVPSFTFYATAEAVAAIGGRPVFCDVEPETFCVTRETVERALTPATKAIVPVHLFGNVAPIPELKELGLPVLEDAAQAIGASLNGTKAGGLGDAATFSFFPSKNLPCLGDGGAVVTSDDELAERVRQLRFHGSKDKVTFVEVGYNSRLDELQAAALRVLLPELEGWNARRRAAAAAYEHEGIADHVSPPRPVDGAEHVYHLYVVRHEDPDELAAALSELGVGARGYYRVPVHRQPAMAEYGPGADLPGTEEASRTHLALPMGPLLTEEQVGEVVRALASLP